MARLFSIKLNYDDGKLRDNVRRFGRRFNESVGDVFERNAPEATAWMKANAPWHDDTGAARASLFAVPDNRGSTHEMLLSHGVHYGIWLETANNRRFQILDSAQRQIGNKLMNDMRDAFRQAGR